MTKKEFITDLGKVLFPGLIIRYKGGKPYSRLTAGLSLDITVKVRKPDDSYITLVPGSGHFTETDVANVTKFVDKVAPTALVRDVYLDRKNLVIVTDDYPWNLANYVVTAQSLEELDETQDCTCKCESCETLRKANADKLRLQHELDQAKAELAELKSQAGKADPGNGIVISFHF